MIIVVGSINIDVLNAVPELPAVGETVLAKSSAVAPGGKGANQALAAARAGGRVILVGAVGQDGDIALDLLREAAVDLSGVRRVPVPTGRAYITVSDSGSNTIIVDSGANKQVKVEQVEALALTQEDIVVLQLELEDDVALAAIAKAKAAGATIIANLAPFRPIARDALRSVDVIVVNEGEAQALAKSLDLPTDWRVVAESLSTVLVITEGERGARIVSSEDSIHIPALEIKAVDTVGAGDTFVGVLAVGLSEHMPLAFAASRAAVAAALACTRPGAQPAMPWRGDIGSALERYPIGAIAS